MNTVTNNQDQIRRYLLGSVSGAEQIELEKQYFGDTDKFEDICAAENDLVDQFIRGELTAAERRAFESHYLASAAHEQKVAFARSLARANLELDQPKSEPKQNAWWRSVFTGFRSPALAAGLAVALVVIALTAVWAIIDQKRMRRELAAAQQQQESLRPREEELQRQIVASHTQSDDLSNQLKQAREQQAQLEAQIAAQKSATPSVVSFILTPGLARTGGSETRKLTIAPGTDQVRLQINFEGELYRSYQVELKTIEGASVWRKQGLKARTVKNGASISLTTPARKLTSGDYILMLSGIDSPAKVEEINRYFFRVEKK